MERKTLAKLVFLAVSAAAGALFAQTITTGDITGTVKDESGAAVSGAQVTLKSLDTGETRTDSANETGVYRFTTLKPGNYLISATTTGLQSNGLRVTVGVGQVAKVDIVAKVQSTQQVVEVTETVGSVNTDNANLTTTFSTRQVLELPTPGGDLTNVAFTVPGVVVSTGAGYGNFSSHGLPGTSNLFTMNGDDYNDPYLNLNNSGASNLLLGQTEIAEANVTQNGYSVQYGRQAGAQVNYVTKGGTNQIHGDLIFNFNNHIMNANDFFANSEGVPRPYAVSRQWGADIGGPVLKNKLFFYSDSEGIYYTLPSVATVSVPSPQMQSYILSNVNPASVPLYTKAFSVYNLAKGAQPVTTGTGPLQDSTGNLGCGGTPAAANGLTGIAAPGGGTFGVTVPCAYAYGASGSNTNKEWLETHRVDWNINDKQKIFFRFKGDHGFQPTGTNLLSPSLNEQSVQPQYEGQINHTYVISPNQVNNFIVSILWYSAIFGPASVSASEATFPNYFQMGGAGGTNTNYEGFPFYPMGVNWYNFPQGRDAGQGQIVDDYSLVKGNHTLKFGVNYRRNRVTDFGYEQGQIGSYFFNNLGDFAAGATNANTGSEYFQVFSPLQDAHIRFYNIGIYAQDEWAIKPNLKLTLGLRMDRTANPTCLDDCFSNLNQPFTSSAFQMGAGIPYNSSIVTGQSHAYYSVDSIVPDPRLGVVWSPAGANGPVLRGGIGVFSDLAPGVLVSDIFKNAPFPFTAAIADGSFVGASTAAGSSASEAQAQYNAFKTGFFGGQTLAQLNNSIQGGFSPFPYFSVPSKFLTSNVIEWSFEIQQAFGPKNVLVLTYSGNHGYNLLVQNGFPNAYVNTTNFANGFGGLPTTAPDPRFAAVTQLTNGGISNYDGLSVQFRRTLGYGFTGEAAYTWSHALDDVSNGGAGEYYATCSGCSFNTVESPSISNNYGNSDYDIRHNFTADFVWDTPWKLSNHILGNVLGNWTVSGKFFWRSGTPFTIYDGNLPGLLAGTNINSTLNYVGGAMTATAITSNLPTSCGSGAVNTPCFTGAQFLGPGMETGFGNIGRNSIDGPDYSDIDATLFKNFTVKEHYRFQLGASAYNLLNHPNFQNPNANIAGGGLGTISSTAIPPTSAYGAFQGSAVSGRVLVVTGRLTF